MTHSNNILAMFPGQGSQHVGMAKDLVEQFPEAKLCFEEAADAIGVDILKLCLEGPDAELAQTANTQPCLLTVSTATWRVLKKRFPLAPLAFAGHSLGEYSALVAADKLDFSRGVFLVRRRGEAMQSAVPAGLGAMAAVINPDIVKLNELCAAYTNGDQSVEIVNFNSPQQVVIAGHTPAVNQVTEKLGEEGVRFVILNVSAPFHSRLMNKARESMTPLLLDTQIVDNANKVIANITGKASSSYIIENLIKQIDGPVLWTQSMQEAETIGCTAFLEIGAGKVLAGLSKRCLNNRSALILGTSDISKAISDLESLYFK